MFYKIDVNELYFTIEQLLIESHYIEWQMFEHPKTECHSQAVYSLRIMLF